MRHQLLAVLVHTLSILNRLCPRCQTHYNASDPMESWPHNNNKCAEA